MQDRTCVCVCVNGWTGEVGGEGRTRGVSPVIENGERRKDRKSKVGEDMMGYGWRGDISSRKATKGIMEEERICPKVQTKSGG